jgi:hypothetical protein
MIYGPARSAAYAGEELGCGPGSSVYFFLLFSFSFCHLYSMFGFLFYNLSLFEFLFYFENDLYNSIY